MKITKGPIQSRGNEVTSILLACLGELLISISADKGLVPPKIGVILSAAPGLGITILSAYRIGQSTHTRHSQAQRGLAI